jgi:hypothetical protein
MINAEKCQKINADREHSTPDGRKDRMSKQADTLFQGGLLASPLFSHCEIGTMKNTLSGTSSANATQLIPERALRQRASCA